MSGFLLGITIGLIVLVVLPVTILVLIWAKPVTSNSSIGQGWLRIGLIVGLMILVFLFWEDMLLAQKELGLFWSLVVAATLLVISNTLKSKGKTDSTVSQLMMSWWPPALKAAAAVIAAVTLLGSGIGMWTASVVNEIDTVASCAANSQQEKCVERRAKEETEEREAAQKREERKRQRILSARKYVPIVPAGAPATINTPACGQGWAKVNIPPKWNVTMGWNKAAASYQWRSIHTGEWQESPVGGADAVRVCAKHKGYANDQMALTWRKRGG